MLYIVQSGDTLSILAKRFFDDESRWKSIAFASGLDEGPKDLLTLGAYLDIPKDVDLKFLPHQLEPVSVYLPSEEREVITSLVNLNLARWGIDEPLEIIHFLGQLSHESAGFSKRTENLNYSAKALRAVFGKYFPTEAEALSYHRQPERIANRVYANRMGNGNEASGDGWRFRGRGFIQLTGRNNYERCGKDLGLPLVEQPDLVSDNLTVALLAAAWYWNDLQLGRLALQDDILGITKRINGGTHGLECRTRRVNLLKDIMEYGV